MVDMFSRPLIRFLVNYWVLLAVLGAQFAFVAICCIASLLGPTSETATLRGDFAGNWTVTSAWAHSGDLDHLVGDELRFSDFTWAEGVGRAWGDYTFSEAPGSLLLEGRVAHGEREEAFNYHYLSGLPNYSWHRLEILLASGTAPYEDEATSEGLFDLTGGWLEITFEPGGILGSDSLMLFIENADRGINGGLELKRSTNSS